jgi:hypothetical protein
MNASKTDTDIFAILAVAQANWPHDPVAGSEAVWTKWRELLYSYSFEEVRATLDALVRTHSRLPPLAELLTALRAERIATAARGAEPGNRIQPACGHQSYPPVDLEPDYVVGPYSAAFARMNSDGWTLERLLEFIRAGDDSGGCCGF